MEDAEQIKDNFHRALKKHGLKNTPQRNLVLDMLLTHGALSNAELANTLDGSVDRATVYRIIDLYEGMRLVTRIWNGWKSKIELSEQFIAHHHHATCHECGRSFRIESEKLEKIILQLSQELEFDMGSHTMEIGGYCKNCKKNERSD